MTSRKFLALTSVVLALAVLAWGIGPVWAQPPDVTNKIAAKVAENAARKAAAARAQALGLKPGVAGLEALRIPAPGDPDGPGGVPHYFGPYGNWAFSPLPKGPVAAITLTNGGVGGGGSGYTAPVVSITDPDPGAAGATATAAVSGGVITGITLTNPGTGYTAPLVSITDPMGTGAAATATVSGAGPVGTITLGPGGAGYAEPVTVTITGGGGTGATATAAVTPVGFVSAVNLLNGGSNYTTATVDITGGGGTGASATATVTPVGFVSAVNLLTGGSNYTTATVDITGGGGAGATATATVTPVGFVSAVNLLTGGSNYTTATVGITGGGGAGAAATATVTPVGFVSAVNLLTGGSNYTTATVGITGGGGTGAAATATVTPVGFVSGITITNAGAGYTTATVTISGDGTTTATADATLGALGEVTGINVTNGGSGYTTATVTISGDGTTTATADAVLDTTHGPVSAIVLTNPGTGYTSAPSVAILGDGGGATADASVDTTHGPVTVTLTNGGTGYTSAPIITINGDGMNATAGASVNTTSGPITAITLTNPGTGYISAPAIGILGDGGGATADASVNTTSGPITAITLTNPGTGYISAPAIGILGDGGGATADATVDTTSGPITVVTLTSRGSGYTDPVTVTFAAGSGAGATATATVSSAGGIGAVALGPGATGYSAPVVTIGDAYGTGTGATATAQFANGVITGITITDGGTGYSAPVVTITDPTGTGATADAVIGGTLTGGILKFVDKLPGLTPAGANGLGQYIPVALAETKTFSGQPADYYEIALVEYAEKMHTALPPTRLRGYVQLETPGLLAAIAASRADADPANDLPLSKGVSVGGGKVAIDNPHYLGPVIVAKGRAHGVAAPAGQPVPVRLKFYNLLPTGAGGNLFLPTDETVMGSGYGPALPGTAGDKFTQNRATIHLHGNNTVWISDGNVHQWITPANEITPYPKGVSVRNVPDMLDANGNVECDFTPPDPNSGCQTFFYTNAQSARLQFYHDHAMGITRLNVYGGEAAGYVLTDAVEQDMIAGTNVSGVNPELKKVLPDIGIPLVIQDRTFVDNATILAQDPTWNWGTGTRDGAGIMTSFNTGDFWYPHVYMTVQNPWDLTGTNAFGRWHYGPWFNPPVPECVNGLPVGCIEVGPVANEYHQADCDLVPPGPGCTAPWEPPMRPGLPNPSMPGESFLDTQLVNGTAYPYLEVEPKAYRFRVLNASNDRFVNLQLHVAADKTTPTTPGTTGTVMCDSTAVPYDNCTEVKMVPVDVAPANQYADTPSGIPDPAFKGPDWILIGTEGGFLPKPAVLPQQPIGYNLDPAYFAFGIVNQYSLFLGSAERADVVVDFSAYAGKTLILYNDSPAPVPAGAAPYDYFTGSPSQVDAGGAPTTQPGYGPNTRTIMQIRVGTAVTTRTDNVTLANLEQVFAKTATKRGVFEVTQDPIIIPQAAYNSAYNNTFPTTAAEQYIQIAELEKTFRPINEQGQLQPAVTKPLEMKAMHDEMGGVYDTLFGRMSGMLGLSLPNSPIHVLIPYGLASPPTDLVHGSVEGTPVGVMPDGTQIWRIFHNGVDTHTIHTHLFHTQLINRVDQSGQIVGDPVPPSELGWKDTFRINPLEVTYLAMRPTVPTSAQVPFEVPDSVRLIDPTLPEGATLIPPPPAGWFDPAGNAIPEILNHYVNFGWEYVWHCHILSHEEMDMMHTLVFAMPPQNPTLSDPVWNGSTSNPRVTLNFIDNSVKEVRFAIERATNSTFTTGLTTFNIVNPNPAAGSVVVFTDTTVARDTYYWYRVVAIGPVVGDTQVYTNSIGFPTMSADSVSDTKGPVLTGIAPTTPADPTNLTATLQAGPQVNLAWRDNANNETGFTVERCTGAGCLVTDMARIAVAPPRNNTGNTSYVDRTVTPGNTYRYRVAAINGALVPTSGYAGPTDNVVVPAIPPAPTGFTVAAVKANGNNYTATLNWAAAANPANFTIQRATNATFTTGLTSFTPAGIARSLTQTVTRNTVYYYRIRANNSIGGSSAWSNALPFPIRTGN